MTKKIFTILLILAVAFTGCTTTSVDIFGRTPNYATTHQIVNGLNYNGCLAYYENITILDKNQELVPVVFSGSETRYVIVTTDHITRYAVSFDVYRTLEPNKTYGVASIDLQGCGYANHHVVIGKVI